MYTNACSLLNKMNELRQLAASHTIDIIAVTETWATDELSDAELAISDFLLFRKDRKNSHFSKGGGVVIYIRDTLRVCLSPSLNNSTFEDSVWCEIYINDSVLLVGVCYRSTSSTNVNDDELICLMEKAASESSARNSQLLLMGDFNYPEISYNEHSVSAANDSSAKRFFDCTQDLFLCQHVDEFTRCRASQSPSILDYVFTCDDDVIHDIQYKSPLGKSDHCCIDYGLNTL